MTGPATDTADVIIIGTGVIGTATSFELAKQGYKTVCVDRNSQIGHGSTAGSCAIIRMHYSTRDGTAFAFEGYHYWRDWADYLGLSSEHALARFVECGCLVMKTEANGYLEKHIGHSQTLSIPIEDWDADQIQARLPIYNLASYAPARPRDDDASVNRTGLGLRVVFSGRRPVMSQTRPCLRKIWRPRRPGMVRGIACAQRLSKSCKKVGQSTG